MKLKSAALALALIFSLTAVPVYAMGAENVALEVGASDLVVSVPLCSYWYTKADRQGITPKMALFNHGFSPIMVRQATLPGSAAVIAGVPCAVMPGMKQDFALAESPNDLAVQRRAVRQQVIFTISNGG